LADWREGRRIGSRNTRENRAILDIRIPAPALSGQPRRLGGKRMQGTGLVGRIRIRWLVAVNTMWEFRPKSL
jgi:hypothetical protein